MGSGTGWRELAEDLAALAVPVDCVGCGAFGRELCRVCGSLLAPRPTERRIGGSVTVTSGLAYEGVPRAALLQFKNADRTGLGRALAPALRAAVLAALDGVPGDDVLLVPMPPTRRSLTERGYDPVRLLLRRARLPTARLLVPARRAEDQMRLDRAGRRANAALSMRARAGGGRRVLLVDDVVTTGATLLEAARALCAAGGTVLGAATVASTPLHGTRPAVASGRNPQHKPVRLA